MKRTLVKIIDWPKQLYYRLRWKITKRKVASGSFDAVTYWRDRARRYGRRSVLNLGHTEEAFEEVTKWQKDILFTCLKPLLSGSEQLTVDFGCGPGRFTSDLAKLTHGRSVGVDIALPLIELAKQESSPDTDFFTIDPALPFPFKNEIDLLFICLALGGIPGEKISTLASELVQSLKIGGLVFLVENTQRKDSRSAHWHYRSDQQYIELFDGCELRKISEYSDRGEQITILAGRRVR